MIVPKVTHDNSWVLSVYNEDTKKHVHNYFCTCTKEFKLQTEISEPDAPDIIICPVCGNDYFKDASEFESTNSTRIWKYFNWDTVLKETINHWSVTSKYDVPIYNEDTKEVTLESQFLLHIELSKEGLLNLTPPLTNTSTTVFTLIPKSAAIFAALS